MKAIIFLVLFGCVGVASADRVLMVLSSGTRSYLIFFENMAKNLVARGHTVDFYTVFPLTKPIPNVTEYFLVLEARQNFDENQDELFVASQNSPFQLFLGFIDMFVKACDDMLSHPRMKTLVNEIKSKGPIYDVALVNGFMSECALPLASIAAKQIMILEVHSAPFWLSYYTDIPHPLSTVPDLFATSVPPLSFKERFVNSMSSLYFLYYYTYHIVPRMQFFVDKFLPEGTPTVWQSIEQVRFILDLSDPLFTTPRPSMPYLAGIGGIQLREAEPLPKDFENFMQSSGKDGVIAFAMGSFVKAKNLPTHIRNSFLEAFAKLKQKVLWKFEEDIKDLPKNVKIVKWMPLNDILGHPKTRLLISHSGRLSLQEAVYHSVPMIGIPLFGDQFHNIKLVKGFGFGEELPLFNATADWVYTLITQILTNERYYQKAQEASSILRDTLNSPAERAVFWTEYIIRHNGAKHLKSKAAGNLNILQYFLLDVFAVLFLALVGVLIITTFVVIYLWKFFTKTKKFPKQKTK